MKNPFEHSKDIIKPDRSINLLIKSGTSNSIDDPIIIKKSKKYDCVKVEYALLDFISEKREIEWKLLEQKLIIHEKKRIDILKIETKQFMEQEIITKIEDYYFDITECFENYMQIAKLMNGRNK